jgi:putative peptidoglycan lipid II flippase
MYAALAGLTVATITALWLFPHYGHVGIAAAIAASGWVGAALLFAILWRRGWLAVDPGIWRRLAGIILSTAIMGAVIVGGNHVLALAFSASATGRLAMLAILVTAGLGVYFTSLHMFGIARMRELLAAVQERF